MQEFHKAVGERLRRLRLGLGRTQKDFADKLHVEPTAISNYEKGERVLDPYYAFKLKLAYGPPLEWLYGGDESMLSETLLEKINNPAKQRGQSEAEVPEKRPKRHATS